MDATSWVLGPVGLDAGNRLTRMGFRTVLVMVPTMTAGTRLMDLVPLLEADHRVQVVFAVPQAGETWHGTEEFVRGCGGVVLPWQQAAQHRWDLVLCASHRHIEQVRGKVMVLPHGAGSLMSRRFSRKGGSAVRETTGLDRELLTYRGRVIPAAIALTHDRELDALRQLCPEAVPAAVVTGDICLDRMVASLPFRKRYRGALGISDAQELITVSSTWSPESTFGRHPELYARLIDEVGDGARVSAVLHPNIWAVHGTWQVRGWLAAALRRGLILIPPEEGWRATMIASDLVLGDHGSTTAYAAAIGIPVALATFPDANVRKGSIAHGLARTARRLDHDSPLVPQLREVLPALGLAGLIGSRPDQAASILRSTMYRLLELPEPSWPASVSPVQIPRTPSHPMDQP
jgi:hypothetical protein